MKLVAVFVFLCVLAPSLADQPAVTLSSPNQGDKFTIGSNIATEVNWPNTNTITYSDMTINLISGDPFDGPTQLQPICGVKISQPLCPAITGGKILINWKLAPSVIYFGQATIWVRAKWQAAGSPVIDTLSQSLTILIVCDDGSTPKDGLCPTPTPAPTKVLCSGGKTPGPDGKCPTPTKKPTVSAKVCPGGKAALPDGSCPTPTKKPSPSAKVCPGGKSPLPDGSCPTPTAKFTASAKLCAAGKTPLPDGSCPTPTTKPTASAKLCPNGKPAGPGGVCESGAGTCPDGNPVPASGACPTSGIECKLTQIGSLDYLCPTNQDFELCCDGECSYGTGKTHHCCGKGLSCPTGSNCTPGGICVAI